MKTPTFVLVVVPWLGACAIFADDARPKTRLGIEAADKYVHRGMVQNRTGVLQGRLDVSLPTHTGDTITIGTFGNMDLRDDVGSAWFPDGHGGRFSQIDFIGTYAHSFAHADVAAGVHNYNLPFGQTFPNGPRSSTSELFIHVATEVLGARPEVQLRYDFDQVDGFYGAIGVSENFPITDSVAVIARGGLGYSSSAMSEWNYGLRVSGWADLHGSVAVAWAFDPHTTIGLSANAATLLDSSLDDWLNQIGIPETNYWLGLSVSWTY